MTIQNPALFISGESHPAEDVRRWVAAQTSDAPGIVGEGDLLVTERDTPAMSVKVAGGRAYVLGDESAYQGIYFVDARGDQNLSIDPADGTNPRKDLVVVKVEESVYSGAVDAASLVVVAGTPAASPVVPAVPANAIVLAEVAVAAGVTSITNANITDERKGQNYSGNAGGLATGLGGVRPVTSATRPASPRVGDPIFETDSGKTQIWNGSAWTEIAYTDVVESTVPAGLISMSLATSVPAGWLELNGQTIVGASGAYPDLWAVAPGGWKSGSDLTLPDMGGTVPTGLDTGQTEFNALEATGGAKTRVLAQNNVPKHYHEMDHNHPSKTSSSAGGHGHSDTFAYGGAYPSVHAHFPSPEVPGTADYLYRLTSQSGKDGNVWFESNNQNLGMAVAFGSTTDNGGNTDSDGLPAGHHYHSLTGSVTAVGGHTHTVNPDNFTGNTEDGSEDGLGSNPFQIMQPYFVARFIIKA